MPLIVLRQEEVYRFKNRKDSSIRKGQDVEISQEEFPNTLLARTATPPDPSPGSERVNTKKWLCMSVHAKETQLESWKD